MQIKTTPSFKALVSRHQTTIPELSQFVGHVPKAMYAAAAAAGVMVSGPQYWIYTGMDGKDETVFTLEIALPIQGDDPVKGYEVKEIPEFKAACYLHEYGWDEMAKTYGLILQHINAHGIAMTNECREVYQNIDFARPLHNRTEVQIGIA